MAVLVDADVSIAVLGLACTFPILRRWLLRNPSGKLALCPELAEEYRCRDVIKLVKQLDYDGRVLRPVRVRYEQERAAVGVLRCRSNDQHVIALLRSTGVRLICTRDRDLMDDVQDRDILNPSAKIYNEARRTSAQGLLRTYGEYGSSGSAM